MSARLFSVFPCTGFLIKAVVCSQVELKVGRFFKVVYSFARAKAIATTARAILSGHIRAYHNGVSRQLPYPY